MSFWKEFLAKRSTGPEPGHVYRFENLVERDYLGIYDDYCGPHCDQRVLHAPGECDVCDEFPVYQKAREVWGIAFTRTDDTDPVDMTKIVCPAEQARFVGSLNAWAPNKPQPPLSDTWLEMTDPQEIERVITDLRAIQRELQKDDD